MSIKEYVCPVSLKEASDLMTSFSGSARLLAGGTDLLSQLSESRSLGCVIVSLKNIKELDEIKESRDGEIFIGSMVRHTDITQSSIINKRLPALAKASSLLGSPSIRNMATIGGNICNASPSAETALPLIIYESKVLVWSPSGEKEISIENFFTAPGMNLLETGEIVKGFGFRPKKDLRADYEKLGIRKAMDIAIVNVGVSLLIGKSRKCEYVRMALGAVAPTPLRAKRAEAVLLDKRITPRSIDEASLVAADEAKPITDTRATAGYRRNMVGVLVKKMITKLSGLHDVKNIR